MPIVDQILDKYVQPIGGETAYRQLRSRVMKGTSELLTKVWLGLSNGRL
jgi:hypothetical protein